MIDAAQRNDQSVSRSLLWPPDIGMSEGLKLLCLLIAKLLRSFRKSRSLNLLAIRNIEVAK